MITLLDLDIDCFSIIIKYLLIQDLINLIGVNENFINIIKEYYYRRMETFHHSNASWIIDTNILNKLFKYQDKGDISGLYLKNCINLKNVSSLRHFDSIHTIYLENVRASIDLNPLKNCKKLQELILHNCISIHDFSFVKDCSNLTHIILDNLSNKDLQGLQYCSQITRLKLLKLNNLEDISCLEGLTLIELSIINCNKIKNIMKIYTDVNIKLGDFEVDKESKIEDIYKLKYALSDSGKINRKNICDHLTTKEWLTMSFCDDMPPFGYFNPCDWDGEYII